MKIFPFLKREWNSHHAFNFFYLICASLGVVGLILVEAFRFGVNQKINSSARNFIASDLTVISRRALHPHESEGLAKLIKTYGLPSFHWVELYSLASKWNSNTQTIEKNSTAKLAQLNFVSEMFPFYGSVIFSNKRWADKNDWVQLQQEENAIWLSRDLAWSINVKINDEVKIGGKIFRVLDIFSSDQFSSFRGVGLAPKIFISHRHLNDVGLIKFGSNVTYSVGMKLDSAHGNNISIDKLKSELAKLIPDKEIKIMGPAESSRQLSRGLNILSDYLNLVVLVTYLLSLVGIYYFTRQYLGQNLKNFAIFKSLGVKITFLFKVVVLRIFFLNTIAFVFSCLFCLLLFPFVEKIFYNFSGETFNFSVSLVVAFKIYIISFLGSLLALLPLIWGALKVPVQSVLQEIPAEMKKISLWYFFPLFFYIVVISIAMSHSVKNGLLFILTLIFLAVVSLPFYRIILWPLEKMLPLFSFSLRHAYKTLTRHKSSTFTIFLSMLTGLVLLIFIHQLEEIVRAEFEGSGKKAPDIFLFDLQDDQFLDFKNNFAENQWNLERVSPMIRGRLVKVNGVLSTKREELKDSGFVSREDEVGNSTRNRGVNLSFREGLFPSEKIVEGQWFHGVCHPEKEICGISLEKNYSRRLGVKLGDRLVYEVSGVEVEGVVLSLRTVKWTSFEPNFFILFQKGAIDDAPKTFLASIKIKNEDEKRKIFAFVSERFPNVSLLEVSIVLNKILNVFSLMAQAIKFISYLSLFVAMTVLLSVSVHYLELKVYEMKLFYSMGVNLKTINKIYLKEFFMIIGPSMLSATLVATLLSYIISTQVFYFTPFYNISFILLLILALSLLLFIFVFLKLRNLSIKLKNKLSF